MIYLLQSLCVLFAMLPVILNRRLCLFLVKYTYLFGLLLIMFATVPALHWSGFFLLENEQVLRVIGDVTYKELNPISFGVFGLTESVPYPNNPLNLPRLNGFSFESIHWAYFSILTLVNLLIFWSQNNSKKYRVFLFTSFILILFHIFLVFSLASFIVIGTSIIFVLFFVIFEFFIKLKVTTVRYIVYFGAVIFPGFLLPAILAIIPDILKNVDYLNFLGKQGNWDTKLGFTTESWDYFIVILPKLELVQQAGHNLTLYLYLQFGLLVTLTFLVFLWLFIKKTISSKSTAFNWATVLALLTHLYLVPIQFFWPSGVMTFMILLGVAHYSRKMSKYKNDLNTGKMIRYGSASSGFAPNK
ncbi:hypothetical protein OAW68_04480 [Alphaproteobacteria bacterium]|nr:hypothetical protein [Alphaproteobacteria bacterium]